LRPTALPALALLALLAAMAGLYGGDAEAYLRLRVAAGLMPFEPFLDLHGVMSAIACHDRGIDVYAANPCDTLGRLHEYSPLWLRLPSLFGREDVTLALGVALAVGFILSLLALPAPRGRWAAVAMFLAVVSPDTVFALERANMDVLIFIGVLAGARLLAGGLRARVAGYGLFLAAGLLKFYPLVLLGLMVRERPAVAAKLAAGAAAVLALAVVPLAGEFERAVENILPLPVFSGTFGAQQLSDGIATLRPGETAMRALVKLKLRAMALATALWLAADSRVAAALAALPRRQADMLLVGGALVVGCFMAGQSVEYRAVFLLMALPALLSPGRAGRLAWVFRATAAIVVWLLWDPLLRRLIGRLAPAEGDVPGLPGLALWTVRELLWWWVVAVLAGLLAALLRRAPAGQRASGLSASQSA